MVIVTPDAMRSAQPVNWNRSEARAAGWTVVPAGFPVPSPCDCLRIHGRPVWSTPEGVAEEVACPPVLARIQCHWQDWIRGREAAAAAAVAAVARYAQAPLAVEGCAPAMAPDGRSATEASQFRCPAPALEIRHQPLWMPSLSPGSGSETRHQPLWMPSLSPDSGSETRHHQGSWASGSGPRWYPGSTCAGSWHGRRWSRTSRICSAWRSVQAASPA
jgi:hypothetical protein